MERNAEEMRDCVWVRLCRCVVFQVVRCVRRWKIERGEACENTERGRKGRWRKRNNWKRMDDNRVVRKGTVSLRSPSHSPHPLWAHMSDRPA
ncbi:hypothetical protein ACFX14_011916 [Malus domestica]